MAFHKIKQAANKVGVLPHVLRFWETKFNFLKPIKSSKGQRLYSDELITEYIKVKTLLYVEGLSIEGAKKKIKNNGNFNKELVSELTGQLNDEVVEFIKII